MQEIDKKTKKPNTGQIEDVLAAQPWGEMNDDQIGTRGERMT